MSVDKWQKMKIIINDHAALLPVNHQQQFKKMVMLRFLMNNLLAFFLQFSGLMMSTLIPLPSPLWFASGTSCALLFLKKTSILPGLYLAGFLAYYLTSASVSLSVIASAIFILQAYCLFWISYRFIHPTLLFYQKKTLIKFILAAVFITASSSLLLVCVSYPFLRDPSLSLLALLLIWSLANFNGTVVFSFAIIAWDAYFPQAEGIKKTSLFFCSLQYLMLFALIIALLASTEPLYVISFALLSLPLLTLITFKYGQFGFIFALFLTGFLYGMSACLGASIWQTPFSTMTLLYLQLSLALEIIAGLCLSRHMF